MTRLSEMTHEDRKQHWREQRALFRLRHPNRKKYKRSKEAEKRHNRRKRLKKYKLTPIQFEEMVANQLYSCELCKEIKPLCIDHCHTTGKTRGLLCDACNLMLGIARDNPTILEAGAHYLRKHRQSQ